MNAVRRVWLWVARPLVRAWREFPLAARIAARTKALAVGLCRWVVAWRMWVPACQLGRDALGWMRHRAPGLAGRGLVWMLRRVPRWGWWVGSRAVIGAWWLVSRSVRWCSAWQVYAPLVLQLRDDHRHGTARRVRGEWTRAVVLRSVGVCAVWVAAVVGWVAVAERCGRPVAVVVVVAVAAVVGRMVRPPIEPEADSPGAREVEGRPDDPFPLADAHTRAEASDAVARALRSEGVDLRMVGEAFRQPWGWEVSVILRKGTPALVVDRLPGLETVLDLPAGGAMAAPDRARRARVVMRLAERDPFESVPVALQRKPGSVSILDRLTVGRLITGVDLSLILAGVHGVVIGTSGSGKSSVLRVVGDAVTACCDAVLWDLDPAGVGLDVLGPAVDRVERTGPGIESALADAVAMAEIRPRIARELGMSGPDWMVSPDHPAVVVVVDEYPRLSLRAKASAVELLRIGRKGRVSLLLASQEATSDTLGDAIADTTALKILLPCRHSDVRLVLGPAMTGEGWRPDRLNPATSDSPEDAGSGYVYAAHHRDPVLAKFAALSDDVAHDRAVQRALHRPVVDTATWDRVRVHQAGTANASADVRPVLDRAAVADVLAVMGTDHRVWTADLLTRLAGRNPGRYGEWGPEDLADALRPLNVSPVQIRRDGRNRNGYTRQALTDALSALNGEGGR